MAEIYLNTGEVAELTRIPESTLRYWRHIGEGPPSFTMGPKRVRYAQSDVLAWIQEQRDKQPA